MNFYIASSFKNIDNVRYISEHLKAAGHNQTYDWTKHNRAASFEELKEIGQKEKEAVIQSDMVIVLLPAGKGSHIELGIALGLNKRIILHSPRGEVNDLSETSTFYHLAEVEKFLGDTDELLNFILEKYRHQLK